MSAQAPWDTDADPLRLSSTTEDLDGQDDDPAAQQHASALNSFLRPVLVRPPGSFRKSPSVRGLRGDRSMLGVVPLPVGGMPSHQASFLGMAGGGSVLGTSADREMAAAFADSPGGVSSSGGYGHGHGHGSHAHLKWDEGVVTHRGPGGSVVGPSGTDRADRMSVSSSVASGTGRPRPQWDEPAGVGESATGGLQRPPSAQGLRSALTPQSSPGRKAAGPLRSGVSFPSTDEGPGAERQSAAPPARPRGPEGYVRSASNVNVRLSKESVDTDGLLVKCGYPLTHTPTSTRQSLA